MKRFFAIRDIGEDSYLYIHNIVCKTMLLINNYYIVFSLNMIVRFYT